DAEYAQLGAGPADAYQRPLGHLALHDAQIELARLEQRYVFSAALGIAREHGEGRIRFGDALREGLPIDGEAAAGRGGAEGHGIHAGSVIPTRVLCKTCAARFTRAARVAFLRV